MKRLERKHLKENELAHSLASAQGFLTRQQRTIVMAVAAVLVVAAVVGGVMVVRQRANARSSELLAAAMVALNARVVPATATAGQPGDLPAAATMGATGTFSTEEAKLTAALPKLQAVIDAYPDDPAGVTARYHYATALASLGRSPEAISTFDQVVAKAGADSLYGRMASLGKADTQARSGQVDAAIATWKGLAALKDSALPGDAILMELARAYQSKGNAAEARKAYTQIVDEYPTSPFAPDARKELATIKG